MFKVDLNCDMGESFGHYTLGQDKAVLDYVTSVNIACGFHAGDPATMRKTIQLAKMKGVAVGAHPGLPDLAGFGRRKMEITPDEAYELTVYQIGALMGFCLAQGVKLRHVKPHGALYNMAAKNRELAHSIAQAVYDVDNSLILYGLAGSQLIEAGLELGLLTASEVFADRTYRQDGTLTPRQEGNSVIADEKAACAQAVRMVRDGVVRSKDGIDIKVKAETICIHGDGVNALGFCRTIHEELCRQGITIEPITQGIHDSRMPKTNKRSRPLNDS